jgi:cysteine desulfurase
MRLGTENVILIVGLGEASRLAKQRLAFAGSSLIKLRDRLHSLLSESVPGLTLNGHPKARLPNTLNVSFPATSARQLLQIVEFAVAASLGSACHSGEHAVSGVLAAINASRDQAMGAVRFSLGVPTTEAEISIAAQAIIAGWKKLQASMPMSP